MLSDTNWVSIFGPNAQLSAAILKLHHQGYGREAIASQLGITEWAVRTTVNKWKHILTIYQTQNKPLPSLADVVKILDPAFRSSQETLWQIFMSGKQVLYNTLDLRYFGPKEEVLKLFSALSQIHTDYHPVNLIQPNGERLLGFIGKEKCLWKEQMRPNVANIMKSPTGKPYIWVQIPDKDWPRLEIIPIADLHEGCIHADTERFNTYLDWILEEEYRFIILVGDLMEMATKRSIADGVYKQDIPPREQPLHVCKMLAPVRHRILAYNGGNHEDRQRELGGDPGDLIANLLDIHYSKEPLYMDIFWKEQIFTFRIWHGRSSARTEGGRINAAMEPLSFTAATMFYISAHTHSAQISQKPVITRNRETFDLEEQKRFIIVCPSFLSYWGSYAAEKGMAPPSKGSPAIKLFPNGDYHVRE